jgi:hypothetical protein
MIVLKTYSDLKTRLQVSKVRLASGQKLTFFGNPIGFDEQTMLRYAQYAIALIRTRVSRGIGSDDAPMPGLKKGYAIRKTKAGKGNRRNLEFTGDMLNNISVRSVSATQARIDITSPKQRIKARANERRAPWWGLSPRDAAQLTTAARGFFGAQVANLGVGSGRGRAFGSSAIWMNPNAYQKGGTVTSLPRAA